MVQIDTLHTISDGVKHVLVSNKITNSVYYGLYIIFSKLIMQKTFILVIFTN